MLKDLKEIMMNLAHDAWRIAALMVAAVALLFLSFPIAEQVGEPMINTFGLFASLALMGIAAAHVARRMLFPGVHLSRIIRQAVEDRQAGQVVIGICIVLASIILAVRPAAAGTLPGGADQYLPMLQDEISGNWPAMPAPSVLAAQVEQETCITLKHRACWSPRAELKTSREYGFGFGQITVTERFNVFEELRSRHPALRDWAWEDRFNPQYQLRALVLKDKDNFQSLTAATLDDHLAFMLACYVGGCGGLAMDRRLCRATPGCDPGRWFGHVEHTSYKARLTVTGYGKSFFQISREYVHNVLQVRRDRYREAMGDV